MQCAHSLTDHSVVDAHEWKWVRSWALSVSPQQDFTAFSAHDCTLKSHVSVLSWFPLHRSSYSVVLCVENKMCMDCSTGFHKETITNLEIVWHVDMLCNISYFVFVPMMILHLRTNLKSLINSLCGQQMLLLLITILFQNFKIIYRRPCLIISSFLLVCSLRHIRASKSVCVSSLSHFSPSSVSVMNQLLIHLSSSEYWLQTLFWC